MNIVLSNNIVMCIFPHAAAAAARKWKTVVLTGNTSSTRPGAAESGGKKRKSVKIRLLLRENLINCSCEFFYVFRFRKLRNFSTPGHRRLGKRTRKSFVWVFRVTATAGSRITLTKRAFGLFIIQISLWRHAFECFVIFIATAVLQVNRYQHWEKSLSCRKLFRYLMIR